MGYRRSNLSLRVRICSTRDDRLPFPIKLCSPVGNQNDPRDVQQPTLALMEEKDLA
jgi:hypothetical protein